MKSIDRMKGGGWARARVAVLGLVLGFAGLPAGLGQVVEFDFAGTLSEIEEPGTVIASLGIGVGTPFSGRLSYDASLGSLDGNANPSLGNYSFPAGKYSVTVAMAGLTFASGLSDTRHTLNVGNGVGAEDLLIYSFASATMNGGAMPGGAANSETSLSLTDSTGTALSSDSLPTSIPSLGQFQTLQSLSFVGLDESFTQMYAVFGTVTSITPVPEPEWTGVVIGVGLAGMALLRLRGGGRM